MQSQSNRPPGDTYVQSFARGLAVIRAFGPHSPRMTLSEVAARTGLTRAGARRILLTLQTLGYVTVDGRHFALTPRILELGYAYLSATPLWDLALPYMEAVVAATGESCSVTVLDGHDVVYILRLASHRVMSINLSVGSRLPAWATAMGRVLLADLEPAALNEALEADRPAYTRHTVTDAAALRRILAQVREQGYAIVQEELEPGLQSVAVPLRDRHGRAIAAMNVSGAANRYTTARMREEFLPPLRVAAAQIGEALRRR